MILRLNYANLIPKRRGPESSPESSLPRRRTPLSVAKWVGRGGDSVGEWNVTTIINLHDMDAV